MISHDAGWFDPQNQTQYVQPYTAIFTHLIPKLSDIGFTDEDLRMLMRLNPVSAYSINVRLAE
ncbi:MAG: hypothetical protein Alis3KO_28600 [Aliiglaciecola sp.]